MKSAAENNQPQTERIAMLLPVRIEANDAHNQIWRELTHLESISDSDADFYVSRPFEVGQILCLTMPLDRAMRRYDFDAEKYSVWGIVRHCHRTLRNQSPVYHIGAAFIGQNAPVGYRKNPSTIYELDGAGHNGFPQIKEVAQTILPRNRTRFPIPIEIYIAVCDAQENVIAHENTVTENISESGASVFSALPLNVGDTVKVIKQHGEFSAQAIVRNRRVGEDNLPRLHLEFINVCFPLEGID